MNTDTFKIKTHEHIKDVHKNLNIFVRELMHRAEIHDDSKFEEPELSGFASKSDDLPKTEYESEEDKNNRESLKDCLAHHHGRNRHHVEFYPEGIKGMTLIDLLEMLADWKAATVRNKNGNIRQSLSKNVKKYNISSELEAILENTIKEYFDK